MSLDSLQKTLDNDTCPTLSRKETRILCRSQIAGSGGNFPATGVWSREHSMARSLDDLCDPECTVDSRREQLGTRYRATTLENLPSATQSDNVYWWINMRRGEASENLDHGSHRPSGKCSSSRRSPLVIEMAREIEHLKSELAAFQAGQRPVDRSEQSAGMVKSGNSVEEHDRPDVFSDRTSSPVMMVKTDNGGSLSTLTQHTSSVPPLVDKQIGKQDLYDGFNPMNNTGDGPGGAGVVPGGVGIRPGGAGVGPGGVGIGPSGVGIGPSGAGVWSEAAGFEQYCQNVNELPLVLELRAHVARLQDELNSVRVNVINQSEEAVICASSLEKNPGSGNVLTESKAVTHLRRVIQVRNIDVSVVVEILNHICYLM